jgi:WD40 repeat protein
VGGLVIKKAYILARQFTEYTTLAERVRAIFFLGTPHRGADIASLLTKILHATSGVRPFVQDSHCNFSVTQSINDEFPQHCQNLQLFSFYETVPTSYIVGKGLVVDKHLAVLGYSNERTAYINANHRDICKYSSQTDPNYLTVRNALASAIEVLKIRDTPLKRDLGTEQRHLLHDFLDTSDATEDDFMGIDSQRMRGSCEWLTDRKSFQTWRDSPTSQVYWISAKPATGKTVLSGYIIKYLKDLECDCAFYFFNHADKGKATVSTFLRSIACQMAIDYEEIQRAVLDICEKDNQLAKADYRTIWRKLFLDGILKVKPDRCQYWVIDALDECKNDSDLIPLLLKASELSSVRIVITSRNRFESYRQIFPSKTKVISEKISEDDTKLDISLYLKANIECLPSVDGGDRQHTINKILTKSAGCFLWVSLVLQELKQVHTSAEVSQVLEDIPSNMDELYSRILGHMSSAPYGKSLAKAILIWTVCAARPLTTEELYQALQLDIKDSIDKIENSIAACCGQLVYVDARSRVHMIHQTARDFLLRSGTDSEFLIERKAGHKRLAMTCLECLSGKEMKGPRLRKLSANSVVRTRCAFASYACSCLFEHTTNVASTDDEFFLALVKFLNSSNVLSWIEYLAQRSDLGCLIQTGRSFRKYLQRRSKYMVPFGKDVITLDSWATDLVRLVAKFGKNLTADPSSIFHLIPPFCPSDSAPRKQFASSDVRSISVLGLSAKSWDDCLSTIVQPGEQLTALTCSDNHFAVGLSNGRVVVYHELTFQEAHTLQHEEPVRTLQFGQTGTLIASASIKVMRIWNTTTWQELWRLDITHECMSLAFTDEDQLLLGAQRNNFLTIWDLNTGLVKECADWTQDYDGPQSHAFRRPVTAALSTELALLAVVYRGQDILLWDIESNALYETYNKDTGSRPGARKAKAFVTGGLAFSLDPNANLLAASYSDGELVLFDTYEGTVKEKTLANAQTLASSPNGRTLACADSVGTIQLFEFETLKLLYRISSDEYSIKKLAFSGDNRRLLDIRGSECRVWDPIVLLRQDADDENSDTVSISTAAQEVRLESSGDVTLITSIACHQNGEVVFCGKSDGTIHLYETKSGGQLEKLCSHASGVPVVVLSFEPESHILISADSSSRAMSQKLSVHQKSWKAVKTSFDHRFGVAVDQVLSNSGHTRVLVCSAIKDVLYSITADESVALTTISWEEHNIHRWKSHPSNEDQILVMSNDTVHLYSWQMLERLTSCDGIKLKADIPPQLSPQSLTSCAHGRFIATKFGDSPRSGSKTKFLLWSTSEVSTESASASAAAVPRYEHLSDQVQFLIGTYEQRLVFLHSSGWICTADLEASSLEHYTRHFFIPIDWISGGVDLMIEVTCNGDVVFVKRHEVAIIRRGLEAIQQRPASPWKRPPLAGTRSSGSGESMFRSYHAYGMGKRPSLPAAVMSPGSEDTFLGLNPAAKRPLLPGATSPKAAATSDYSARRTNSEISDLTSSLFP